MKRFASVTLALLLGLISVSIPAPAEEARPVRVAGELAKSNMTEAEFDGWLAEEFEKGWYVFEDNHLVQFKYFDDLSGMLLALNAGTIDEIDLPRFAAEYVVKTNPEYQICCAESMPYEMSLLFGFLDNEAGRDLQGRINGALRAMKADGSLDALEWEYLKPGAAAELTPAAFDTFPESNETIRILVTGDLPPIDYIDANGIPAGFNTAVLAEIGRRLGVNIELISSQTGSRTIALTSHKADAVFWYMKTPGVPDDMPEGLVFSDSYLDWDIWLHIKKASANQK